MPPKKPMSAEEMAENIVAMIDSGNFDPSTLVTDIADALRQSHAAGRNEGLDEAAKRLYELGEEKYPKAVFQNEAGTFARHLLEVVLPDEIRALKTPEGGK